MDANIQLTYENVNGTNVFVAYANNSNSVAVSIAVDYTPYYIRIANALESMNVYIDNINTRASSNTLGNYIISVGGDAFTAEEQRAITMSAIVDSGGLDSVKEEIANPTQL